MEHVMNGSGPTRNGPRTDWASVLVWAGILIYVCAILAVAGYFIDKALSDTGPACVQSGVIDNPTGIGQTSSINCGG